MSKPNKREAHIAASVLSLIAVAFILRIIGKNGIYPNLTGWIRGAIQCGMMAAWAVSVRRRVLQKEERRYLTAIACLLLLWLVGRTFKFLLFEGVAARYCWYAYYIPMVLAPLLGVFAALCLCRSENYRLPGVLRLLYIPALAVIILILTNDLHHLAFINPESPDYVRGPVYYIAAALIIIEAAALYIVLIRQSRLPGKGKRILLPLVPAFVAIIYAAAYAADIPFVKAFTGDMTAVFCIVAVSVFEACIFTGLIQTNAYYDELFRASTVSTQIADKNYAPILSSNTAIPLTSDLMKQACESPILLPGNIRLSGAPISCGYVFWTDDVSAIARVSDELNDARESLEDKNSLLSEEYALKAREAHVAEQDRLYDVIQRDTAKQIDMLSGLTDSFELSKDERERRRLLGKMAVIGAFLKRRSNLVLFAEKSPACSGQEVGLTFGESLESLRICGVSCGLRIDADENFPVCGVIKIYDFFEDVIERAIDTLTAVTVNIVGNGAVIIADTAADLSPLISENISADRDDDGAWQLSISVGGDAS